MGPSIFHKGGLKVAKQNNSNKQLTAQDIHQLVSVTLQEHFQLDMTEPRLHRPRHLGCAGGGLCRASQHRNGQSTSGSRTQRHPGAHVGKEHAARCGSRWQMLEKRVNELLTARLPRKLFESKLPVAIDLTELPYHGQHADDDPHVRRGRAKQWHDPFLHVRHFVCGQKEQAVHIGVVLMGQAGKSAGCCQNACWPRGATAGFASQTPLSGPRL
jgi:hypothetical protein